MRTGWTPELAQRVMRADPAAYPILEIAAVSAEDLKARRDDWNAADSTTGFYVPTTDEEKKRDNGTLKLAGTVATLSEQAVHDSFTSDLKKPEEATLAAQADVIHLKWSDIDNAPRLSPETTIDRLKIYVDPDIDGGGHHGAKWRLQIFEIVEQWEAGNFPGIPLYLVLRPIGGVQSVDISGSGEGYITFDLSGWTKPYQPALQGDVTRKTANGVGELGKLPPQSILFLYPVSATGVTSDNAGYAYDAANEYAEDSTDHITYGSARLYPKQVGEKTVYAWGTSAKKGAPRVAIEAGTYSPATISFTSASNRLDLGATPASGTTLELGVRGERPGNSSITTQISADGLNWYQYVDGDQIGVDRTSEGGSNLSALPRQRYYYVRATLTPST